MFRSKSTCLMQWLLQGAGLIAVVLGGQPIPPAIAAESDGFARNGIFAEQHVINTSYSIHRRVLKMSVRERFEYLARWILPGEEHDSLRMQFAFSAVTPAPPGLLPGTDDAVPGDGDGGEMVSPVYDLVDVAKEISRLNELLSRVEAWEAEASVVDGQVASAITAKQAMLALIRLAMGDGENAATHLEEMIKASVSDRSEMSGPTAAEFLVANRGLNHEATREIIGGLLIRYQPRVNSTFHRSAEQRHLASLIGRLRLAESQVGKVSPTSIGERPLAQWKRVSQQTAETRGTGSPASVWSHSRGLISNVASHNYDFLYFDVPMRGSYEVECDVSVASWRDICLMTAGTWVIPTYTQTAYDVGHAGRSRGRTEIPRLTHNPHWVPYRTVVRDGTATTYLTGRKVHVEKLESDHDPWLAIRSSPRHHGHVRNIRITGDPVIPDQIELSTDPELNGWLSYYSASAGGKWDHWKHVDGEIRAGRTQTVAAIPHREKLLRYHRPMLEDGVIEYEFLYLPGSTHVHPSLDRLVFLLDPSGVRIHWATDGRYERTGISPINTYDEPDHRQGPEELPLLPGQWNRVRLQVSGDTVTLWLADQMVYEREIEPSNQRNFGLFHFADATEVRVRDVVWKGEWPKSLPPVQQQELAADGYDFLDSEADHLKEQFTHDFVKDGLPGKRFAILRGDAGRHVEPTPNGVRASQEGKGGYRNATIAAGLKAQGDFDITVAYDEFEATPSKGANGNLMLLAILDNETADECCVLRRTVHHNSGVTDQVTHCFTVYRKADGERRAYFGWNGAEERSGRLRLSRRGNQVYFLSAEGDSSNFRLRGQREFSTDDVSFEGTRLIAQIEKKGGGISVVWKNLSIRAEKIITTPVELVELNKEREALPQKFAHDFSKAKPASQNFYIWTDPGLWDAKHGGWRMTAVGSDSWDSIGASVEHTVGGDFDVTTRFQIEEMATPKSGGRSAAYLQVDMPAQAKKQFSVFFGADDTGTREVIAEVRESKPNGGYRYRYLDTQQLESVDALRIARRGSEVFLVAESEEHGERIMAREPASTEPIQLGGLRFLLHTGGPNRSSRVLWKSFDLRAESLVAKNPDPVEPSPFQRAFDFFLR